MSEGDISVACKGRSMSFRAPRPMHTSTARKERVKCVSHRLCLLTQYILLCSNLSLFCGVPLKKILLQQSKKLSGHLLLTCYSPNKSSVALSSSVFTKRTSQTFIVLNPQCDTYECKGPREHTSM